MIPPFCNFGTARGGGGVYRGRDSGYSRVFKISSSRSFKSLARRISTNTRPRFSSSQQSEQCTGRWGKSKSACRGIMASPSARRSSEHIARPLGVCAIRCISSQHCDTPHVIPWVEISRIQICGISAPHTIFPSSLSFLSFL